MTPVISVMRLERKLLEENDLLGRKINSFIQYVETHWNEEDHLTSATSNQ